MDEGDRPRVEFAIQGLTEAGWADLPGHAFPTLERAMDASKGLPRDGLHRVVRRVDGVETVLS